MPKFVPRQRKHKVIARRKAASGSNDGATIDANTTEILPQEEQERAEKKATLKEELVREAHGKISGKKKKRLDKYIVRGHTSWRESQYFASSLAPKLCCEYLQG
jgi:ATP-dependent RNA helicase DHX37/DHR1